MKTGSTDVLIVGAGPTGLSLAAQLIRYGIDFRLIDQKPGITDLSKALVVHARSLEIYDQLGLAGQALEQGEIAHRLALMHQGRVRACLDLTAFGGDLSPFPFFLILEQSRNEALLYAYLRQHGQDVGWQTELGRFTQDAQGVSAERISQGRTESLRARYLVGCDGAGSSTRQQLGMPFEGSTYPRLFYVADLVARLDAEAGTAYAVFAEQAFVLFFPLPGTDHWRMVGNLPEREQDPREPVFADVEPQVRKVFQSRLEIQQVKWFSSYRVHTRHAARFVQDRVILAGDAAHVHTPAGGQGMNTGIQDAYNLAWKLALVLRGQADAGLLETYHQERLANARELLHSTDQLFELAAGSHWFERWFRNEILPPLAQVVSRFGPFQDRLFPLISQIGIDYRSQQLSEHHGDADFKVKAGDRMPYFCLEGENLYDRLTAPCFHLLAFSDGRQDLQARAEALQQPWQGLLDWLVVPLYPAVADVFGVHHSFWVLLRPDQHLALLAKELNAEGLAAYFSSRLGQQSMT